MKFGEKENTEMLGKINELLNWFGSYAKLSKSLDVSSPQLIQGWVKRKKVPAWRFKAIDALYKKEELNK